MERANLSFHISTLNKAYRSRGAAYKRLNTCGADYVLRASRSFPPTFKMVMVIDALLDACIFDSRKFDHFHLKYFDWLAQVVSLRRQLNYCGTRSNHILRAWDGHKLTRNNVLCGNIDSKEDEFIVPPADEYNNVPDTYFFDILLFGEWIERAALLKSKSFVVISNLHIFRGIGFKNPILALHGSPYFGRGVFEIDREFLSHHHRLIKLENYMEITL
ncbi:hypothetical protein RB195_010232 [Necator americanus]|uniref:Core-2/I-Branching enzyme n=1 Tax=Necator americanus TaxID=51031 RepID=A0ABR1D0C2_NECAM